MKFLVVLPLLAAVAAADIAAPIYFAAAPPALHYAAAPLAYSAAPIAVAAAPAAAVASVVTKATSQSQYHSQAADGQYSYGYAEPNGAKAETRHADGTVTGTYTHPLPDGTLFTNNYVADEYGFKSNQAPTAHKDFQPKVKSAYQVNAPIYQTSLQTVAVKQAPITLTKSVDYVAPAAPAIVAAAPLVKSYSYKAAPILYKSAPALSYKTIQYAAPSSTYYKAYGYAPQLSYAYL